MCFVGGFESQCDWYDLVAGCKGRPGRLTQTDGVTTTPDTGGHGASRGIVLPREGASRGKVPLVVRSLLGEGPSRERMPRGSPSWDGVT